MAKNLICELFQNPLNNDSLRSLLTRHSSLDYEIISEYARHIGEHIYGKKIYLRGLIEISNICRNNCYYCGLRKNNKNLNRYHLTNKQILDTCERGYQSGFRSFVLQGGEQFTEHYFELGGLIRQFKKNHPECSIAFSLGEQPTEILRQWYDAGVTRYLLRQETITHSHYSRLHPPEMTLQNRVKTLYYLKNIGYQTGTGFIVGSPFQTFENIIADIRFIKYFAPAMIAIGPFIAHPSTPFANYRNGSADLTRLLISIFRGLQPNALIPATTALNQIDKDNYLKGVRAGANVIMINLTPTQFQSDYELYQRKIVKYKTIENKIDLLGDLLSHINYAITLDCDHYPCY